MNELEMFIDGASKGNPGHSGIGIVIVKEGRTIKNISRYIGQATNNIAEYTALIDALQEGISSGAESITINTDSQLLYRQIKKEYRVKHANIIGLYAQALQLMAGFKRITLKHIPREENCGADKLATKAIKETLKKKSHDICVFENLGNRQG